MKKMLLGVAVMAALVVGALSISPTKTSAAAACDAHGIGNRTMTNDTASNTAYKVANGKATITFKVVGNNCKLPVTMIAWTAPNGTTGKPYSAQRIFASKTDTFNEGTHQMTIALPDCFYQVDTVTGTQLRGSTGGAHDYNKRQVGFIHGGTKSCVKTPHPTPTPPTPTPPNQPAPPAPTPPTPTVTPAAAPVALTNAGPMDSAVIALVITAVIGGYVFAQSRARRQAN